MELKTLDDIIQPKIETLKTDNEEILEQIEMIVKVLERRKERYEKNLVEINHLENLINKEITPLQ